MIYFDNIVFELQYAGGISLYWSELLSRHKIDESVFFGCSNSNIFASSLRISQKNEVYPEFISRRYLPFWPRSANAPKGKHIFHSSYFRYSNHSDAINITTVHDFTYEYYSRGIRKWVHGFQKKKAIKKSAGIICVSNNTKKDLLKFYPWVDESKVRVISNGVGSEFHPFINPWPSLEDQLELSSDKPFFLFVGDRSNYKNFDVFAELADIFPDFNVVIVGGKPFSEDEKQKLSSYSERVKHLRGVSSSILNLLYNAAFALIYPSSYEGFGIPPLEAMKAGCPVISTNFSSIPEVLGDAALLVDEINVDSFSEKVMLLFNEGFRRELKEKGFEQVRKYSWDKCFLETYSFYQELLGMGDCK